MDVACLNARLVQFIVTLFIAVAALPAFAPLANAQTPEIRISGGDEVTEGDDAIFTVTASPAPTANLAVKLSIIESSPLGDYVAAEDEQGEKNVTILANTTSATYTVATVDDSNDENPGVVSVILKPDSGYTVASFPGNAASVQINDNDPEISIALGGAMTVTEGDDAIFTVMASSPPIADLTVKLTISETRDYVAEGELGNDKTVTIPANMISATYTVSTVDDSTDKPDGEVTVTVVPPETGTRYTVGTNDMASVNVIDNEAAPTITLIVSPSVISENGGSATVTARLSHTSSDPTMITVEPAERPNTLLGTHFSVSANKILSIAAGELTSTGTVTITALDDTVSNSLQKSVDVSASASNALGITSPSAVNLKIFDDESTPTLKVLKHELATIGSQIMSSTIKNIRMQSDMGSGSSGGQLLIAGQSVPLSGGGYRDPLDGGVIPSAVCGASVAAHPGSAPGGWLRSGDRCHVGAPFGEVSQNRILKLSDRELLGGSSFTLSLSDADATDTSGYRWGIWGRGDYAHFSRDSGEPVTYDGSMQSIYLGVDARTDEWLKGVAVAKSTGRMKFDQDGGLLETRLTAIHPYGQWRLSNDLEWWAILGVGSGKAERSQSGMITLTSSLRMSMAATGLHLTMRPVKGVDLATRIEASGVMLKTGESEFNLGNLGNLRTFARQVRAGLEGSKRYKTANGAEVVPHAGIIGRHDGGDGETGSGLDVTGGIRYEKDRSVTEVRVRKLLVHSSTGYDEWGASLQLRLTPHTDGSGFSASLRRDWGAEVDNTDRLWDDQRLSQIGSDLAVKENIEIHMGYGIALPNRPAMLTPFAEFAEQSTLQRVHLGVRLTSEPSGVNSKLYIFMRERELAKPERGIMFNLAVKF